MGSVVIHVYSEMNYWMDALVFVDEKDVDRAQEVIQEGLDKFFEEDSPLSYSEMIEEELLTRNIDFSILVGEQDDWTNDTTIDSQELFNRILRGFGASKIYELQI